MSDAREVVARALFAQRYPGVEWNPIVGGWALIQADIAVAALAADPDVVERLAHSLFGDDGATPEWAVAAARAALAAALTPDQA